MRRLVIPFSILCITFVVAGCARLEAVDYTRQKDIVYGHKWGTALTMDVFQPSEPNGAAVVWIISGGWKSSAAVIPYIPHDVFTERGYTVFAVVHGSQPKYTVSEEILDIQRAVRFIRTHADGYGIDPDRIAVVGSSSGGHLALLVGVQDGKGNVESNDMVDHASSRVQAVGCFYPPTDFIHWGNTEEEQNTPVQERDPEDYKWYIAAFDFHEWDDSTGLFQRITDNEKIIEILEYCSPITHVSADDPPTFIIHGDVDKIVPIQQSEDFVERMKEAKVPTELIIKPGAGHGWKNNRPDWELIADWFDHHLGTAAPSDGAPAETGRKVS